MTACAPAGPNVQDASRATPVESVTAGLPTTLPPPAVTAKVTETPVRGFPDPSVTRTAGAWITVVEGGAVWASAVTAERADDRDSSPNPETPPVVAVMVEVPSPTPVSTPEPGGVSIGKIATPGFDEVQAIGSRRGCCRRRPSPPLPPANPSPTPMSGGDSSTVTLATVTAVTVTAAEPDLPSLVAVTRTAPGAHAGHHAGRRDRGDGGHGRGPGDGASREHVSASVPERRRGLRALPLREVGVRQRHRDGLDGVPGHGEGGRCPSSPRSSR